jgi:hypothetical protein
MLVRLLVVLTLLGQPAPRACTCAATDTSAPASTSVPSETAAPAPCRCGKNHQHAKSGNVSSKCAATAPHRAPHHQHAPDCPACSPDPVDAVAQPVVAVIDADDLAGLSFDLTPAPQPAPVGQARAPGTSAPHVPLFITFRVLRN